MPQACQIFSLVLGFEPEGGHTMHATWLAILLTASTPRNSPTPVRFEASDTPAHLIKVKELSVDPCDGIWGGTITISSELRGCWILVEKCSDQEWFRSGMTILGFRLPTGRDGRYVSTRILYLCFARGSDSLVAGELMVEASQSCPDKTAEAKARKPTEPRTPGKK